MNIYSSSSHNYPKQEPTHKSFSKWMDKQTMVHPSNGELVRVERNELSSYKSTRRNLKCILLTWKKPVGKGYRLCNSNYPTFWERPTMNYGDNRKISGCQGLQGREGWTVGAQRSFRVLCAVTVDMLCILYVTKTDSWCHWCTWVNNTVSMLPHQF